MLYNLFILNLYYIFNNNLYNFIINLILLAISFFKILLIILKKAIGYYNFILYSFFFFSTF
jgi:hypothetical protein